LIGPINPAIKKGPATEAIKVVFHNAGMRSGIECSLCAICPRDRIRGCCTISPVFLLTDIGYFLNNGGDDFVNDLLNSPYAGISADQLMVNALDPNSDVPASTLQISVSREAPGLTSPVNCIPHLKTCRFHHPEVGCRIPMSYRNMVCRQYLCPSVKLWQDTRARLWVDFWLYLQEEEIRRQQLLTDECTRQGVSLLVRRNECLRQVRLFYRDLQSASGLPTGYPEMETLILRPS
jgi:hypothetical protein